MIFLWKFAELEILQKSKSSGGKYHEKTFVPKMGHFPPNFGPKACGLCSQNSLLLFLKFTRTMGRSEETKVAILNVLKKILLEPGCTFLPPKSDKKREKREVLIQVLSIIQYFSDLWF